MRKIEQQMNQAIAEGRNWKSGNTEVVYFPEIDKPHHSRIETSKVYLHGNHIATYVHETGKVVSNTHTLMLWPTPTTMSRLRGLGVNVLQHNHDVYLNGQAVA